MDLMEVLTDAAQYTSVGLIGAFVGVGELISRYKDDPYEAIANRHAILYTLVNVLASLAALLALKTLDLGSGGSVINGEGAASVRVGYVLLAGFGAMGVLRSAAFTMRVGQDDISIGPSALLQIMLAAADRAVDRDRAKVRAQLMARTMESLPFSQIEQSLPQLAFSMMQNVKEEEKQAFNKDLEELRGKTTMDEVTKSICMGLSLSNIVGQGVVDAAVAALKPRVQPGLLNLPLPEAPARSVGTGDTVANPPDNKASNA